MASSLSAQAATTEQKMMHLDMKYWLHSLNLSQYQQLFNNYQGVQDILHFDEATIKDRIGIKNSAHRAKIVSSLVLLKAKHSLRTQQLRKHDDQLATSAARYSTSFPDNNNALAKLRSRTEFRNSAQSAHNKGPLQTQHSASVLNISRMDFGIHGAYVTEAESLRRQLEWELSQDGRCYESHAWYHGAIPRSYAESLLRDDGQFLIRDSSSGPPGDLVLSCFWKGARLHFIIRKVVVQPNTVYASIQYTLEEEAFETIPDLVTCYVGSGKAVTAATGAKITTPVNRTQPLSLYSSRYNAASQSRHPSSPSASQLYSSSSLYSGRNPLPAVAGRVRMVHPTSREYSTQSLPRPTSASERMMRRNPSDPSLSEDGASPTRGPPKPSRLSSQIYQPENNITSSYDNVSLSRISESAAVDVEESEAIDVVAQLPIHPATLPRLRRARSHGDRPMSETRNSFLDRRSCDVDAEATFNQSQLTISNPDEEVTVNEEPILSMDREFTSIFDLENFQTLLLPPDENKPLEMMAIEGLSSVFDEHSSKSIALHLLHGDLDILGGLSDIFENVPFHYQNYYVNRGVISGIELCMLPNGEQLRLDLLERTQCLRLFVAVTILTCPTVENRTAMLNLWVEVAIESKTAFGNMYGFAGIMFGLCMPQIQRLTATWNLLRQKHTATAFTFETRLKPQHRKEVAPHAPNTTVPDMHSAILLWQATMDSLMDEGVSIPFINLHLPSTGPDYGLDLFASHMELIRSWSLNLPLYLRNSRNALEQFKMDDILADVFRTEFQLKFLWGSRDVLADSEQRYAKFERVLTVLSERSESS